MKIIYQLRIEISQSGKRKHKTGIVDQSNFSFQFDWSNIPVLCLRFLNKGWSNYRNDLS